MSFAGTITDVPKRCKGCRYRETWSGMNVCCYSNVENKLRNCPPEKCTHYIKKNKKERSPEE